MATCDWAKDYNTLDYKINIDLKKEKKVKERK